MSLIREILTDHASNKIKNIYIYTKLGLPQNTKMTHFKCFQCVRTCFYYQIIIDFCRLIFVEFSTIKSPFLS